MNKSDIRIVFMGTPKIASDILSALSNNGFNVVLGICQPDKPVGRKKIITAPPVKEKLTELGIPCYQPSSLKNDEAYETISSYSPDIIVTCAYGKILPGSVLGIPKFGCLNVHASLLPLKRGSAPIQRAIMDGDEVTGITIMKMDEGLDTGDIISTVEVPVDVNVHTEELFGIMGEAGAKLLLDTIMPYVNGETELVKQDDSKATYCPPIAAEEGEIDWNSSAFMIHKKIHALSTWPGAYTVYGGKKLKIYDSSLVEDDTLQGQPGEVVKAHKKDLWIMTGEGILAVNVLQTEGGKRLNAIDCAHNFRAGQRLG